MSTVLSGRKRILHFFQDEKVVNDAIDIFENTFPDDNLFVVLTDNGKTSIVHDHKNTLILTYSSPELKEILSHEKMFDEIICHSFWVELAEIIAKSKHPNITWVAWGADMYEEMLCQKGFRIYSDEDELMRVRARSLPVWIYRFLVFLRDRRKYYIFRKAMKNVRNLAMSSETTYRLFLKHFPEYSHFRYKEIFYYPIEDMLDNSLRSEFVSGKDIWVNNSAAYNGNHIEIFGRLQSFDNIPSVHVPLSYGLKKWVDYVNAQGREMLGEKFEPMLTFIPRSEYYKCFLNCNGFIFGHYRSCAFGNVLIALYFGAKVFLFRENPLLDHFRSKGIVLFCIENELSESNVMTPLPISDRIRNREIINRYYSRERLVRILRQNF